MYNISCGNICFCTKFSLDSILIVVTTDDMSDRPHQNQLETEHTDEDDGESMEKFDSILDQPRCQPDVDESAENQTKVNKASWGKGEEPKC